MSLFPPGGTWSAGQAYGTAPGTAASRPPPQLSAQPVRGGVPPRAFAHRLRVSGGGGRARRRRRWLVRGGGVTTRDPGADEGCARGDAVTRRYDRGTSF